jgi:high affinity Mn2+ porin
MVKKIFISLCILFFLCTRSNAQDNAVDTSDWSFHIQQTVIGQIHPDFHSPYSGGNSLQAHEKDRYSVTSTVFIGRHLWQGGDIYIDPELAGGQGLSGSSGVAGALNGETYRIGNPSPELAIPFARIFLRQNIALGNEKNIQEDGQNFIDEQIPKRRITITLGKYSLTDMFDNNSVSHDPRSQFFNWSLMSAGAWDYPADTKGYTIGGTIEYISPEFSVRAATDMVAKVANQLIFDPNFSQAHSETVELEIPHNILPNPGTIRILVFHTLAHMGNYRQAIAEANDTTAPDITATRAYGRSKYGFDLNLDQQFGKTLSGFMRASWNDGKNETWMFTEIDQSVSAGISLDGFFRKPGEDIFRGALVANGISNDHRDYLAKGGYGFILGDGKLNYATEFIVELQYLTHINNYFTLSVDYQFVANPGYNADRGPVNVFGLRGHVEF